MYPFRYTRLISTMMVAEMNSDRMAMEGSRGHTAVRDCSDERL